MIHLDTNFLVDLVTAGSPGGGKILAWLRAGKSVATSAVAWSEFCNGPLSTYAVLDRNVLDFTCRQAEAASRLFNLTGSRRGSHVDCMIAAATINAGCALATFNRTDFERLISFGLTLEG